MNLSARHVACFLLLALAGPSLVSCGRAVGKPRAVVTDGVVVSVRDQKLAVMRKGEVVKTYKVSTSKFGVGDQKGSCKTPLGVHSVAAKIGDNVPKGMVFKSRQPTGEVVRPDSPGRDPIVTRIIWLRGQENLNKNAFARMIYIHGTTEEKNIGKPASYGCIRMKSADVLEMYSDIKQGDPVVIEMCSLKSSIDAAHDLVAGKSERTVGDMPLTSLSEDKKPVANVAKRKVSPSPVLPKEQKGQESSELLQGDRLAKVDADLPGLSSQEKLKPRSKRPTHS